MKINKILSITMLLLVLGTGIEAQTINYEYDNLSRLTQVKYENGTTIMYQYDQVGNRTFKILNGVEQANLEPPSDLMATVTENDVELNWDAPENKALTGYNVFRDGNKIADEISPTSYADFNLAEGTYLYCVSAVYDSVESTKICEVAVIDLAQPLVANFSATPLQGLAPLAVSFTDLSVGDPTSWLWNFGNGSVSSLRNPTTTYFESGTFTVSLTVSNSTGSNKVTKQGYIHTDVNNKPVLTSIDDVPADQGGWVYVNFLRTFYDTDSLQKSNELYNIELNLGNGWIVTETIGAYGASSYSVLCHTPIDSSHYSNGIIDFRVIAIMEEGNFVSEVVEGYSVDNIAPDIPDNLNYELLAGVFTLNWNNCLDNDFSHFAVYKNDVSGNFPITPIATTSQAAFGDQVGLNEIAYYVVTAMDFHGNESGWSEEVQTSPAMRWELKEGWSGISSFIDPSDADIENMFASIQSKLIILQNDDGMYWPGQNVNTLGNWNMDAGYKIKVSENTNLTVSGNRLQNQTLAMTQSWNLMPVLSECPADVAALFAGKDVSMVKEVAGWRVYWPEFGINTLETLKPGKAYFALMNGQEEIVFPECNGMKASVSRNLSGFQNLTGLPTPITHSIAIPAAVVSGIQNGDIIGTYDDAGICYGAILWNGENTALTAFGNDPLTAEKDGFDPGETLIFKSYSKEDEHEQILDVNYNFAMPQSDAFAENGLSAISSIKAGATGIENPGQVQHLQIHPNPTHDAFTLSLETSPQIKGNLELYNLKGQLMLQVEISSKSNQVEIQNLPAGVYIATILIDNQTLNKRIIKE